MQQRFRFLLVDEFQDTDPLQAEIVLYLCEREPRAGDWREVVLEPGKLFLVGDPKQSIYRFRRADIALYDQVKRLVLDQPDSAGAVPVITQNFRTTPSIVEWVNGAFDGVFALDAEEGRQPRYERVEAYRPPSDDPRVSVLLGRQYAARAGESETARRDEAAALAALLVEMQQPDGGRWAVQDRDAPTRELETLRAPRWGDIAVLVRQTTGLETYEQALRDAGVPYRVDGGKTYFARREVADALLCLRAADDPADAPALYGALHSTYFGFSDADLFLFWSDGGVFDLFAPEQPTGHAAVSEAMAVLRRLHGERGAREPHELVAELVRLTGAAPFLAATGPGAPQAIANLEKLIERARAFAEAGGGGLTAFLAWTAEASDAAGEQESQVDDDDDVVRIVTIHKAKGLEYPIVVLAGGALAGSGGGGGPIVDRAGRAVVVKLRAELPGTAGCDLEPRAYAALRVREQAMAASELRRLLYVAATRARDHLVVSCFGKPATQKGEPSANVLLGPLAAGLPRAGDEPPALDRDAAGLRVLAPRQAPPRRDGTEARDESALLDARAVWGERRAALLSTAARAVRAVSPSGLEQVDDVLKQPASAAAPGRARALAVGTAVHRVMELCDLTDQGSVSRLAESAAAEAGHPDLGPQVATLALTCWGSPPVRAAASSPRVYRELPVRALLGGTLVEGAVDLLFEDEGQWVVVDFKTDVADDAEVLHRYQPQGAAYALAVEAAIAAPVRDIVFVRAAAGGACITVPVDDALRLSGLGLVTGESVSSAT